METCRTTMISEKCGAVTVSYAIATLLNTRTGGGPKVEVL